MKYYIIAGEASGDLHASNLIRALKANDPDAAFRFWGGKKMQEAAPDAVLVRDYREGAVMGISDTLSKASSLLRNISLAKADILEYAPDVVIPVDYPGFNMRIARFAHRKGLKVFYFIAPKTWATRASRNKALKRYVDKLFIIFPFEVKYFEQKGVNFSYNGNPLVDEIDTYNFSNPCDKPYIAILPGSRKGEIQRMMPVCLEAADKLGCKVIIAGAPGRTEKDYPIEGHKNVELLFNRTYDILKYAQAAIVNSGTASLEAAIIGTPQMVCWSSSKITAFFARKILKVYSHIKYISLANIIQDKPVFKEIIQEDLTASNILTELSELCSDEAYRATMIENYAQIRAKLGGAGASDAIAKAIIKELAKQ